jgi:hypothetical protein
MNMIRMIKLFGWEMKMQDKILETREEELGWLWKKQLLDLINNNIKYVQLLTSFRGTNDYIF